MDVLKTRKAVAAKAYWIHQQIADGATPDLTEYDYLLDYADPTDTLSEAERELLRLLYLALDNDYIKDGLLEFPDEAERAEMARSMLE